MSADRLNRTRAVTVSLAKRDPTSVRLYGSADFSDSPILRL